MLKTKTILIVDDSVSILELLRLILEQEGYNVISASDGKEALKHFTGNIDIDLLLTDLHMPNMNGLELIKEVRKKDDFKYLPILFLTTETKTETKREAKEAGATGWITKPFDKERLLRTIKKVLR
jgi:two-component system chemotaxis response regulator CheY